jgi:hypothetical protein
MRTSSKAPHATWVTVLFIILFLLDTCPLILGTSMGGWTASTWMHDAESRTGISLVFVGVLVGVAGIVGARRGWNPLALSTLALLTIGWIALVAWVLVNVLIAVIALP